VNPIMSLSVFVALSILLLPLSWDSLKKPRSHGFTRFFAFECILILIILNVPHWFEDPFCSRQIISWLLLGISLSLALHGFHLLRIVGRPSGSFENTTQLVAVGAYRRIRHPLYASLLAGTWGVFMKDLSPIGLVIAVACSLFLFLTARREEGENLARFGTEYAAYMARTRMFIPYLC